MGDPTCEEDGGVCCLRVTSRQPRTAAGPAYSQSIAPSPDFLRRAFHLTLGSLDICKPVTHNHSQDTKGGYTSLWWKNVTYQHQEPRVSRTPGTRKRGPLSRSVLIISSPKAKPLATTWRHSTSENGGGESLYSRREKENMSNLLVIRPSDRDIICSFSENYLYIHCKFYLKLSIPSPKHPHGIVYF